MRARRSSLRAAALLVAVGVPAGAAMSQSAKDVVGSWMLVSADAEQGGKKVEVLGPNPTGFMMLGSDGRYAIQQYRSDLPKFAANVRDKGTPQENKAVVQGSISHYGTFSLNEADKTIVFRIEVSSFRTP